MDWDTLLDGPLPELAVEWLTERELDALQHEENNTSGEDLPQASEGEEQEDVPPLLLLKDLDAAADKEEVIEPPCRYPHQRNRGRLPS
eukprot:10134743-Ditylum_brightwellii.AAC.1